MHRVHKVCRLQNTKCAVCRKRVVCKTAIYTMYTQTFIRRTINTQCTLRHTFRTSKHKHTDTIFIIKRSPATLDRDGNLLESYQACRSSLVQGTIFHFPPLFYVFLSFTVHLFSQIDLHPELVILENPLL